MKEADFVRLLKDNFLGTCHRNHGGRYGTNGLPDFEGCHRSETVIIEAKRGHIGRGDQVILQREFTTLQKSWLRDYYNDGAQSFLGVFLEDEKKIIFFSAGMFLARSLSEDWDLHLGNAFTEIDFLDVDFVNLKVWDRTDTDRRKSR